MFELPGNAFVEGSVMKVMAQIQLKPNENFCKSVCYLLFT